MLGHSVTISYSLKQGGVAGSEAGIHLGDMKVLGSYFPVLGVLARPVWAGGQVSVGWIVAI